MEYGQMRGRGRFEWVVNILAGRRDYLLSLVDAKEGRACYAQRYQGLQEVPIRAITGSMDRSHDFTRDFKLASDHTRDRWASINRAMDRGMTLPPVSLYKMGNFYFVKDGHHRVSVARHRGADFIDAEVTECVPVPHDAPAPAEPAPAESGTARAG